MSGSQRDTNLDGDAAPINDSSDAASNAAPASSRRRFIVVAKVVTSATLTLLLLVTPEMRKSPLPLSNATSESSMSMHQRHHGGMAMSVTSESGYLVEMIPHHEEAIRAARQLLAGTNREQMRLFARSIISIQQAEVETMQRWLAERHPGADLTSHYIPMMREYGGMSGDELDRAFLVDMIPHHMTAVMMSRQLISLGLAEHVDVNPFASTIADAQYAEIQQMHTWVADWFGADAYPHMSEG